MQPGTYNALIQPEKTRFAKAKTGTPQMAVSMRLVHFLQGGGWVPLSPAMERTLYITCSESAWQYAEAKLGAMGFNGNFHAPDFSDKAKTEGVQVICKAGTKPDGSAREDWELASWGDVGDVDSGLADVFTAKWKNKSAAATDVGGETKASCLAAARATHMKPGKATTEDQLNEIVFKAIAKIGKPEGLFTAADWQMVKDSVEIPF